MKFLFIVIIFSIILITGCAQTAENKNVQPKSEADQVIQSKNSGGSGISIKIAVAGSWGDVTPLFVAQEKGIFKKNNVNVDIQFREQYTDALDGLYAEGDADGIVELTQDTVVTNPGQDAPAKIVYVFDYSVSGDAIVGKANSIADLKGKRIGGSTGLGASRLFVLAVLEKNGMKESDVSIVETKEEDVLAALDAGIIDAGHVSGEVLSNALKRGYKTIATTADVQGLDAHVLAFKKDALGKKSVEIQALVNSLAEARAFVDANREEAIAITAKQLSLSKNEYKNRLDTLHGLTLEENINAFKKTTDYSSLYKSLTVLNDFYYEGNSPVVVGDMIEPQFINSAKKS